MRQAAESAPASQPARTGPQFGNFGYENEQSLRRPMGKVLALDWDRHQLRYVLAVTGRRDGEGARRLGRADADGPGRGRSRAPSRSGGHAVRQAGTQGVAAAGAGRRGPGQHRDHEL